MKNFLFDKKNNGNKFVYLVLLINVLVSVGFSSRLSLQEQRLKQEEKIKQLNKLKDLWSSSKFSISTPISAPAASANNNQNALDKVKITALQKLKV